MIDCLIVVWLLVWNWVNFETFLKVKWEGIKGLSQTFILHLWSLWIQILFKYKTLEWRWNAFFHLYKWNGFLKIFEFHLELFPIQQLYATQWFSWEKIKWLLQIMKYELGVSKITFKVFLNLFSIWSYLSFIQIIFLQK